MAQFDSPIDYINSVGQALLEGDATKAEKLFLRRSQKSRRKIFQESIHTWIRLGKIDLIKLFIEGGQPVDRSVLNMSMDARSVELTRYFLSKGAPFFPESPFHSLYGTGLGSLLNSTHKDNTWFIQVLDHPENVTFINAFRERMHLWQDHDGRPEVLENLNTWTAWLEQRHLEATLVQASTVSTPKKAMRL